MNVKTALALIISLAISLHANAGVKPPDAAKAETMDQLKSENKKLNDSLSHLKLINRIETQKHTIDSLKTADKIEKQSYNNIFHISTITIYLIGIALCAFLFIIAYRSGNNKIPYALGLPSGSVRAIIAILAIILYVLISLTLALIPLGGSPIAADVSKTLGSLVLTISAFYFASKAAEQGNKAVTENLNKILDSTTNANKPVADQAIIRQAISANKADWLKIYNCTNIAYGKKKSNDTIQDIDCIIFYVISKTDSGTGQTIPPTKSYSTQGKTYDIPTDVVLNPIVDRAVVDRALAAKGDAWKKEYNATNVVPGKKMISPSTSMIDCITFTPADRTKWKVPETIPFEEGALVYLIPTQTAE